MKSQTKTQQRQATFMLEVSDPVSCTLNYGWSDCHTDRQFYQAKEGL